MFANFKKKNVEVLQLSGTTDREGERAMQFRCRLTLFLCLLFAFCSVQLVSSCTLPTVQVDVVSSDTSCGGTSYTGAVSLTTTLSQATLSVSWALIGITLFYPTLSISSFFQIFTCCILISVARLLLLPSPLPCDCD